MKNLSIFKSHHNSTNNGSFSKDFFCIHFSSDIYKCAKFDWWNPFAHFGMEWPSWDINSETANDVLAEQNASKG